MPESGVFEFAPDRRFGIRALVLKVGQLITGFVARQVCWLVARVPGERVMNRETGLHLVIALAVKLTLDVASGLGLDAVDRFVDNPEAHFRVGRRRAVVVASQDRVGRNITRLELFLVRHNVELQHLVARGHGQQLALVVHVAVFDERNVEIDIRFIFAIDGHIDDDAAAGRIDLPDSHDV